MLNYEKYHLTRTENFDGNIKPFDWINVLQGVQYGQSFESVLPSVSLAV